MTVRVATMQDERLAPDHVGASARDVDRGGLAQDAPGDLGRRRRAEPLGGEPALLAVRPAQPGVGHRLREGVPVAVDQAQQGLRPGAAHRVPAAERAAEQHQPRHPLGMARGVGDRVAAPNGRTRTARTGPARRRRRPHRGRAASPSSDTSSTSRCEWPVPRPSYWTIRSRSAERAGSARRRTGICHSATKSLNGTPGIRTNPGPVPVTEYAMETPSEARV